MNNAFDFSVFSRQSPKGILVIYIHLIYKVIKVSWILLFLVLKDFSRISKIGENYIYLSLAVILIFLLIRAYLIYKNFQFKIANEHFILKQGIIKKTSTSIPFHRIQNINFKQNIIQQIIGVYEVNIETAGSSKAEISIKALSFLKAEALKEIISKSTDYTHEIIEKDKSKPILKIGVKELFKVSLTENHLQNLVLFLALILGFFQQIEQVVDSLGRTASLDGFIEESTNALSASFFLVTILLIFLTIIALMSSFVKIFLIHFNLTAYLKEDAFEINQGLLTKKSIVLKKQKVQNITVSTNPLKRLIGISFITFKQAISGRVKVKKDKLIRIAGCKKDQVDVIKTSLFDVTEVENKEKKYPDTYYKRRIFIFTFLFLTILYSAIYLVFKQVEIFYSTLFVLPVTILLIRKKVKKRFYKITDSMLLMSSGLLETHLIYFEIFKIQNIKMKQTIFQKRSNVSDIIFQTASGKIKIPCIQSEDAVKIYNHTLYKVETSKTSWM
ncbi:PH domain-containing protein [Polaribacter litorisediminis]|uniref:PH domain-containing protein n=1 Tax=Polaribacter litorisediminis TaxID=1908341 RepID=UPI001CBE8CA1|nr:PH domain-containing protein [Polaribacter litorisediminis]UAM99317.1 PH domain-containing protein [Polaribacter litorisediminis]